MSDDLVAFLRARLDDDERIAQLAAGTGDGEWTQDDNDLYMNAGRIEDASRGRVIVYDEGAPDRDEAVHIARHDPKRTLAEVAAKREVIRLAERAHDYHETFMNGFGAAMEDALRLFAQAYAAHPDYREEWRP